ncbi:MAG TPA: acireductone synthase [Gemmatimonadales bacterium]
MSGSLVHSGPDGLELSQIGAVLLDIEGTTTPLDYVHKTLFGYARARVTAFLERRWNDPDVRGDVARLTAEHLIESPEASLPLWRDNPAGVTAYVQWLMQRDGKSTGLKSLQGKIWEEGYRSGELKGEVYPDVPPALERWRKQGLALAIFSSGSVQAQQSLFKNSNAGDLSPFFRAYFDTTTGSKKEPRSYTRIAQALKCRPAQVLFISDVPAELDAARTAGMQTALCVRNPADAPADGVHRVIHSFDDLLSSHGSSPPKASPATPPIPADTEAAVSAWMRGRGWQVHPVRWELDDPNMGFYVWEELSSIGKVHALWLDEAMIRHLKAKEVVQVLEREGVAEEIRISYKVRIEERGAGYRVSVVPRRSGEFGRVK